MFKMSPIGKKNFKNVHVGFVKNTNECVKNVWTPGREDAPLASLATL